MNMVAYFILQLFMLTELILTCQTTDIPMCPYKDDFLDIFKGHESEECPASYPGIASCACTSVRNDQSLYLVNCSYKWQKMKSFPKNTTHLSLRGSSIGHYLGNENFLQLSELIYLDLSFSGIERLENNTFKGLRKLQILLLGHNYLIVGITTQPFAPLAETLEYLDLSPYLTSITTLPSRCIADLINLKTIVLPYHGKKTFGPGFAKMNKLRNIIMPTCQNYELDDDTFQHLENKSIVCINMTGCTLTWVDGAFRVLPRLSTLDLSDNPILFSIRQHNPDTSLIISWMEYNQIRYFNIKNTGIVDVVDGVVNLTTLEHFIVDQNDIVYWTILSPLRIFSGAHNAFSFIGLWMLLEDLFESPKIEDIDLSYLITQNDDNVAKDDNDDRNAQETPWFMNCTSSSSKNCSSCINNCSINLPPTLRSLNFAHSSGKTIGFMNLGQLTLVNNSSLTSVDMSYTEISYLQYPIKCQQNVSIAITTINLEGNRMVCIHPEYFSSCTWTSLNHLQLSHNNLGIYYFICEIKATNPLAFVEPLTTLHHLDLSYNMITEFNADMGNLVNLSHLDLSYNPLNCLQKKVMRQLEEISWERKQKNESILRVILQNIDFKCDCNCMDFYEWLARRHHVDVIIGRNDHCSYDDGRTSSLQNISIIVRNLKQYGQIKNRNSGTSAYPYVGTICWFLLVTIGTTLYRFRHTIKYL